MLYILDEPSIGLHQRDNAPDRHARAAARPRQHRDRGRARRGHDARCGSHRRPRPGRREHGGYVVARGRPGRGHGRRVVAHGPVPGRRAGDPGPTAAEGPERPPRDPRREPAQPPGRRRDAAAGRLLLRDRRVRVRQVDAGQRGALPSGGQPPPPGEAAAGRAPARGRARADRQDHLDRPVADRSHAALEPATYTGVFDSIRDLFSRTQEARARGYKPGRFSFNVKGGRCEVCRGDGQIKIEMHFLPDVYVPCEQCGGSRYNRETLEVRFKGKTIADVLAMPVEEAVDFFRHIPKIKRRLQALHDVGLDYIRLGQPATTLSGGEAQRVKLATELAKVATGRTLYILDEPTTGLHFADVQRLLEMLDRLVEAGNTVVVIEHNLDVIKTADRLIDLRARGRRGGRTGGGRGHAGRGRGAGRVVHRQLPVGDRAPAGRAAARAQGALRGERLRRRGSGRRPRGRGPPGRNARLAAASAAAVRRGRALSTDRRPVAVDLLAAAGDRGELRDQRRDHSRRARIGRVLDAGRFDRFGGGDAARSRWSASSKACSRSPWRCCSSSGSTAPTRT